MGTEIGEWAPTLGSLLKGLGSLGGTLALRWYRVQPAGYKDELSHRVGLRRDWCYVIGTSGLGEQGIHHSLYYVGLLHLTIAQSFMGLHKANG